MSEHRNTRSAENEFQAVVAVVEAAPVFVGILAHNTKPRVVCTPLPSSITALTREAPTCGVMAARPLCKLHAAAKSSNGEYRGAGELLSAVDV